MLKYIILFMTLLYPSVSDGGDIVLESFTEAQKLSEELNKPLLVIFGSENCEYCIKLKRDIVKQPIDHYIVCYIDIYESSDPQHKKIKAIPESRIIVDKKIISTNIGYNQNKYSTWLNKYNGL